MSGVVNLEVLLCPDDPRTRDEQLAALERDNTAMRDHLTRQQAPYQSVHGQQGAPPFNGYFDRAAYHQTEVKLSCSLDVNFFSSGVLTRFFPRMFSKS